MDMHPPPAIVAQLAQEAPPAAAAPAEAPPVKVDVGKYIPSGALSVTVIVTVTPPSGAAMLYAPGYEDDATLFKGPKSVGEIRLAGSIVYVKLVSGATSFSIQYLNWREP